MVTIYGQDNNDQLGSAMHAVDLDGDGFQEIVVSAALNRAIAANTGNAIAGGNGPTNMRNNCGDTYIIFGGPSLPSSIKLQDIAEPCGVGAPLPASTNDRLSTCEGQVGDTAR